MFAFFKQRRNDQPLAHLTSVLVAEPARSMVEVMLRCEALESLSSLGPAAQSAMPAIFRTLVVSVHVDCGLVLRVAAAEAVWRVGGRHEFALPFLVWALKDEYWGECRPKQ